MAEDSCYPRKQRQRKHGCKHGSFQNGKNKLLKGWGVRSKKANEEMALYNLTMKVNRLELLKANIGLEMIAGTDEMDKYMAEILQGRTEDELKRMGGILGKSVKANSKKAAAIPNASFHNATFSDRIWMYQDLLKADLSKLLQTGLIQGKNPRVLARELKKAFDTTTYNAERLMRTELARVQTEAQKQSFQRNGFSLYEYIANSNCCDICQGLNGKHFKVESMMPGENAPPMHPNCRCSTAAWEDSEEYEAWLDYLDKGGSTAEWESSKHISYNSESLDFQSFKAVTLDKNQKIDTEYKTLKCTATRAVGYNNEIYISDKLTLKRKQLNYVNARINAAANYVPKEKEYAMPRVIICDSSELPTHTVAAYTASDNTLRISSVISTKQGVLNLPGDGACSENHNGIYVHEMLHWSDAQKYIRAHGNANGYIQANIKESKKHIDKLEKNGYNINDISRYASRMLNFGRYDEAWTEYRTTQILEG